MKCMFCKQDSSGSVGVEHIIPESLGANFTLPKGFVCDKCNNYFSRSIEKALQEYHFIGILRPLLVKKTKKGKGPQLDISSLLIKRDSTMDVTQLIARNVQIIHDTKNHVIRYRFKRQSVNIQLISRAIYKIAFEFRCKYESLQEVMKDKYDSLRSYIRVPRLNEYWDFAQKPQPMGQLFDYSRYTKYGSKCDMLKLYDLEFLVEESGRLPIDKLRMDKFEIINRDDTQKTEYEELILPYIPFK